MSALVLVFSFLSRLFCRFKNLLYDIHVFTPRRAPLPVISVGSVAFGGTEKTPIAMEVLRWLLKRGYRPALVSRGYKGRWERKGGIVSDGHSILATWKQAGDEPFLIARAIPQAGVFVGRNRFASCQSALAHCFNVAVLDDGFQHRRLGRDLDIAISPPPEIKALREPRSSLLRADIVLVKKTPPLDLPRSENHPSPYPSSQPVSFSSKLPPARRSSRTAKNVLDYAVENRGLWPLWQDTPLPTEELPHFPLFAFCGIARPDRFLTQLESSGAKVVSSVFFFDHHPYPDSSLRKIVEAFKKSGARAAVTTEKDAIKLLDRRDLVGSIPLYYLRISIALPPEFFVCLERILEERIQSKGL